MARAEMIWGGVLNKSWGLKKIIGEIKYKMDFVEAIHFVFILIKAERNNPHAHDGLGDIMKAVREWGIGEEHIKVFITHGDVYSKSIKEDLKANVSKFYKDIAKAKPEMACFAKLDDICEEFKEVYAAEVQKSVKSVMRTIEKAPCPVFPPDFARCKEENWWSFDSAIKKCVEERRLKRIERNPAKCGGRATGQGGSSAEL